jgi:DNA replication protein DnaC
MNTADTLNKMQQMRLLGMSDALRTRLETGLQDPVTNEEFISFLVQAEWEDRQERRLQRYLKNARFRYRASFEEIHYHPTRNLDKDLLVRLASCQYIKENQNVIIEGATGTGKSFIAAALGHQACIKGHQTRYFHTQKLFTKLKMAKADNTYQKELAAIERQELLILDDFGLHPLDANARLMLMEIMEDRHGKKATIITSQFPVDKWHDLIADSTIADAILDRIVHRAHRIKLKGESMRKQQKIVDNT